MRCSSTFEFPQLQNLGEHQRDLVNQSQNVISSHFRSGFFVADHEMDHSVRRGDEEAIEIFP